MKKKYQPANRVLNLLAFVILFLIFIGVAFKSNAQTGPANVNSGIVTWVDAGDIDGDGLTNDQPTDGTAVSTWSDKSGNGKNATTLTGAQSPTLQSDATSLMGGNSVLYFPGNSVLVFNGIDLRASALPNATIFTVYRHTTGAGVTSALWGVDNGGWDRFIYTRYGSAANGIASQGPVAPTNTIITGSGTLNKIQLFTAVYQYNVAGASAFYLGGQLVGTFHDRTDLTAAQVNFRLGWDGDDGYFYGEVAELIVYNRKLTDCEILTVNKYLSQKYQQDFNNLSSNYSWPSPYNTDIAVIGMKNDVCGSTTYSQATSSLLTLSNATSNTTAGEYLSTAHNSGAIASTASELPSGHKKRTAREWRVDEDGDLGNVDVCFDVTGVGFAVSQATAYSLLEDADGDFSNATVLATSSSLSGNNICFPGVNLNNGSYYTIAEKIVAPTISTSSVTLPEITEDIATASNTGVLVSTLLGTTATDGNGDAVGMAVVSRDASNGTWEFLETGIWWNFDRNGAASETQALLLPTTAQIRFTPAANYNGPATFTYRAWDQTSGTSYTAAVTSSNGGTTAFSSTTGTASITVSSVNDAPVINSTIGVLGVAFDGANDHATLSSPALSGDFTIEAWVYVNQHQTWSRIVDMGNGAGSDNIYFAFQGGTNYLTFGTLVGSSGTGITSPSAVPTGVWKHLACVNNGSGMGYLYIDGVLVASGAQLAAANVTRTLNYVGRSNWSQDAYFNGSMRELRMWDVARTQTQISQNMNASLVGNETGLKVYYRMDEGTGTVLNDDSGNGKNGTMQNGPTWTTYGSLLSSLVVTEDTPTAIPGFQTEDADAGSNALTFTLSTLTGKINVLTNVSGGITSGEVTANNSSSVTISSTTAKINATFSGNGILYVPTLNYAGTDKVTLNLNDNGNSGSGGSQSTSYTFDISVTPVNDSPVITSTAVTTINEDALYTYTVTATDVDVNTTITYSAPVLPSWLAINATTGVLTGTPTNAHVGTHNVTVRASDGTANTDQSFVITVANVNDAPAITSTAVTTVNEDATYSYTIVATDVDAGAGLAYSAPTLPTWLSFNTTTRVLSGTPTNSEVGTHNVTLRVNDGNVNVDETFTITVTNTNDAATVTSTAVTSVNEDVAYIYTLTASDVDAGAVLTYSAPTLPSWLAFNTTTHVLSGTPSNSHVGTHNVTLRVSDGTVNTDQAFVITVSNTNDAPAITSSAVTTVNEDIAYSYTLNATDVDAGDVLTFSAPTLPTWLNFNTTTRILSGTPTNNEVGTHNVVLRVNDGTVNTDQSFTITVANINDAPVITSTAVTSVNEDVLYSYTFAASDVDAGNVLTYSAPVLPSWLNFNATTGLLSGTPTNSNVGDHGVTLRVKDGTTGLDQSFTITVVNVNDTPTITSVAVTSVNEDAAYSYTITAYDVDAGTVLTYSAPSLPSWLSFNTTTRVLSGTPVNSNVGSHNVTLRVNDGTVDTDQSFTITVANMNDAPTITSTAGTSINEDAVYTYTIVGSDVDAGTVLTFSAPVLPSWLSFNSSTGILSGTPVNSNVGSHNVTLRVSDGTVNTDQAFTITVANTNDNPEITSVAVTSADEDALYSYTVIASDEDAGNTLTYSATTLPTWLTFNTTTHVLSGTPTNAEVGSHSVILKVNDGIAGVTQNFTITVVNTNDAPVISSSPSLSVNEDASYNYTLTASDQDAGSTLTFSATSLPTWLTFNDATGALTGIPSNSNVGIHTVKLRVNDGTTNTDQIFDIEVINTNDSPVITSSEVTSVVEDAVYTYTFGASDVDAGSTLTYSAVVIPAWLSFNISTGVLSGTPTNAELGSHNIKLRVSDGTVDVDQVFSITVTNANDDAVITSTAVTSVNEDALYSYTFEATDVDAGDVLTYSAPVLPSWLTFNSSTGILSGTPANAEVGSHSVTLRVNDGTSDVNQQFTIAVSNTNDESVITSTAITTVDEDAAYSYTITASDVDVTDHLIFSATSTPSWLTFNATTGILSGTPTNSDLGNHNVTLRVNDGTTDVDQTFTITVGNTNDVPVISSIPVSSVSEDAHYTYTLVATDVDVHDVITYSALTLPSWMTFHTSTGILSGTPSNDNVGSHTVKLLVNDGSTDIEQTFTITVSNTNDIPVVTSTALTSAEEDALYKYMFTATDVDQSDALTYSVEPLPSWLSFNTATGELSGTPSNDEIGNHSITLHVSDGTVTVDQIFQLVVANANDAPVVTSTPVVLIDEDALYTYTVAASDADLSDMLTFTATVLPSWLTFNSETGTLSGTPANDDVGAHTVTLRVSDGNENIDQTFSIEVNNINDAPVVTSPETTEAKENSKYSYTIQAVDTDASSTLTYSTSALPSWLTFNPESGVLEGTPTNADAGTYLVTVTVSDGVISTEQVVTIVVAPNMPPVVNAGQTFSIDEKSATGTFVGEVLATDEDGATLTNWQIVDGNDENTFALDPATGKISVNNELAIDFESHSSFTLMVTVGDGFTTSESRAITITINDVMEGLHFYAAFSPNGDNVNDTWEVDGLQDYPNSVLKIFNSDGIELFHNVGYTAQWNGISKGKEMPLGTYFYLISLNDGSGKKLNGHLMIIK